MSVIVLDVEATSHHKEPRASVIDLGAVALTTKGRELGSFSTLIRPLAPLGEWSKYAMEVNRIPASDLTHAPAHGEVFERFLDWMGLYKPIEAVLAYNVSYDQRIVVKTWPLAEHLPWGPCVMRRASEIIQGNRVGVKLHEAARSFGVSLPPGTHHRAVYDARVASLIWSAMVDRGVWAA